MSLSVNLERAQIVASMINAMLDSKQIFPRGESSQERGADLGLAFKALFAAVVEAEKGG